MRSRTRWSDWRAAIARSSRCTTRWPRAPGSPTISRRRAGSRSTRRAYSPTHRRSIPDAARRPRTKQNGRGRSRGRVAYTLLLASVRSWNPGTDPRVVLPSRQPDRHVDLPSAALDQERDALARTVDQLLQLVHGGDLRRPGADDHVARLDARPGRRAGRVLHDEAVVAHFLLLFRRERPHGDAELALVDLLVVGLRDLVVVERAHRRGQGDPL